MNRSVLLCILIGSLVVGPVVELQARGRGGGGGGGGMRGGGGGGSGIELGKLLRRTLSHLDGAALRQRMDFAVRLCSSAMYAQARSTNPFRGQQSDFFIEGLIDALVGLLSAPESKRVRGSS